MHITAFACMRMPMYSAVQSALVRGYHVVHLSIGTTNVLIHDTAGWQIGAANDRTDI